MPHVVVKLWPGKSEEQKAQLAEAIVRDMTRILSCGEGSVSVGFEEIASEDWTERVYKPDILDKWSTLAKEPGYGPRPDSSEDPHG
jgi:4-oxalocrotonate tautomerase